MLADAPVEAPYGPADRADDAQGVGEAGGGRGPAAWRAWHADGRRGTSPTALSTVSLSSREPGLPPNTWKSGGSNAQVGTELLNISSQSVKVAPEVVEVRLQGPRGVPGGCWGSPASEDGDVKGKVLAPVLREAPTACTCKWSR